MGLFSAVSNLFRREIALNTSTIGGIVTAATRTIETALVHPVGFFTNTAQALATTAQESLAQRTIGAASNALIAVAPLAAPIRSLATTAARAAVSTAPRAIATTTAGLVATGYIASGGGLGRVVDVVSGYPEGAVRTGEVLATGVENLGEADWYKIARSLGLGAGISILAAGLAYGGYKLINGKLQKVEEETAKLPETPNSTLPQAPAQSSLPAGSDNYSTIPTDNSKPIENPTTTIRTGKKRRRKVYTIKDFRQINQRVNVIVQQRNTGVSMRKIYKGALLV